MGSVDQAARAVTFDVVVWGPEGSGKSTLLRQLVPSQLSSPPIRGFDFVSLKLGSIRGFDVTVRCQGVPGRDDAETRARRADLRHCWRPGSETQEVPAQQTSIPSSEARWGSMQRRTSSPT